MAQDLRLQQLSQWLESQPFAPQGELQSVSGDASFRRYFRFPVAAGQWLIAVDAPPPHESLQPFMAIAASYHKQGLVVPQVHAFDQELGFMVLDDLGDTLLFSQLTSESVARDYYQQALSLLPAVMRAQTTEVGPLPSYDKALLERELALFHDWLLVRHLGCQLTSAQQRVWQATCDILIDNALEQPQVGVHRDYHSRNIMVMDRSLALIDFQDAVVGPVTYDAVSLLRDCYVSWPDTLVQEQKKFLHQRLQTEQLLNDAVTPQQFSTWFDLMGVQRHLKAAGIFARLKHRDDKPGYMADVPRTLAYVSAQARAHSALQPFAELLHELLDQSQLLLEGSAPCEP